jgi:hypothetical protein
MYTSYQFLLKVKSTSTGKLLDSLPRIKLPRQNCSDKFNVAYCPDTEGNLPTPPPSKFMGI